jgi:hypothetical protein
MIENLYASPIPVLEEEGLNCSSSVTQRHQVQDSWSGPSQSLSLLYSTQLSDFASQKHDNYGRRLRDVSDNMDNSGRSQEAVSSVVQMCPNPDVILVVSGSAPDMPTKSFAVSTDILSSASPYFRVLFSSNFAEGQLLRKGNCPEICLNEDNADAIGAIFAVLHNVHDFASEWYETSFIEVIATHIDKYQIGTGPALKDGLKQRFAADREPQGFEELSAWVSAANWCALLGNDQLYTWAVYQAAYGVGDSQRLYMARLEFDYQATILGEISVLH